MHTRTQRVSDLTSKPADGSRETFSLFLFPKQFLPFFSTSPLHILAEWGNVMPAARGRVLVSVDGFCILCLAVSEGAVPDPPKAILIKT